MKFTLIKNANVVLENGIIYDGELLVCDNKIKDYGRKGEVALPENYEIIDGNGKYVGPGFVDIHVHDGGEYSTSFETVKAAEFHLKHGTTSLLATPFYSMNFDTMVSAVKSLIENIDKAPTVKGIYFEGPYMNPNYGANAFKNPWRHGVVAEEYKVFVDLAGSLATVWAIAPEVPNVDEFMEYCRKVNPNTIFAIGHTEATPDEIRALSRFSPGIQTHTMCATGRKTGRGKGTRNYGPDEYCWQNNDIFCELISDSYCLHVSSDMQQLLIHTKGVDRVVLITDHCQDVGETPAQYAHITDLSFDPNGGLSGSRLTMNQAALNIMRSTSCGICEAFIMASTSPAKAIGMGHEFGSIERGKLADLVFVDDKFNVDRVMLGGEICKF